MGRDYSNESITESSQNPETSPGDLRRLAVTQTPVENHQLTLMRKTLIIIIIIIIIILLWDFDLHTDRLISAKRPDLLIIKKNRELVRLWTLLSQQTTE